MAEVEHRRLAGDSDERELQDMIEHWVSVIDRWVQRIESGLDGGADGGAPVERHPAPDSAPSPETAT